MLTIQFDGKTYKWLSNNWGVFENIKNISLYEWGFVQANNLVRVENESGFLHTSHTVEQLVKLGYLEEVKENEQTDADRADVSTILKYKEWSPVKGEIIEVSDDGIKWYTSKFIVMRGKLFGCLNDGAWKYARFLQTDKVEELPEFDGRIGIGKTYPDDKMIKAYHQIELLTKTLNQVIRASKNN